MYMIKSVMVRWTGHVARIEDEGNSYRILVNSIKCRCQFIWNLWWTKWQS